MVLLLMLTVDRSHTTALLREGHTPAPLPRIVVRRVACLIRGRSQAAASIRFLAVYCDGCSEWVVVVVEVADGIVG
jgi:hypothetical protein